MINENRHTNNSKQIPRYARNDTPLCVGIGEIGGVHSQQQRKNHK